MTDGQADRADSPDLFGSPETVSRVLDSTTMWFVVGLGNNPDRDAFGIARLLQSRGKRIVPIYPRAEVVHGEQGYATIAEAAAAVGPPDVVDMFVRSDRVGPFVDEAIAWGPRPSGCSSVWSTRMRPSERWMPGSMSSWTTAPPSCGAVASSG